MDQSLSDYIKKRKDLNDGFRGKNPGVAVRVAPTAEPESNRNGAKRPLPSPVSSAKRIRLQVSDARERLSRRASGFDARTRIESAHLRQTGDLRSKLSQRRPASAVQASSEGRADVAFQQPSVQQDLRLKIRTSTVWDSQLLEQAGPRRFISVDPATPTNPGFHDRSLQEDFHSVTPTRGGVIGAISANRDSVVIPVYRLPGDIQRRTEQSGDGARAVSVFKEEKNQRYARYSAPTPASGSTVLVSNLHPVVTEEDIVELFSAVGPLVKATMKGKGVAEIQFVHGEDANKSITRYHNRELDGMPMALRIVPPASRSKEKGPGQRRNDRGPDFDDVDVSLIHKALFSKGSGTAAKPVAATTFTVKI